MAKFQHKNEQMNGISCKLYFIAILCEIKQRLLIIIIKDKDIERLQNRRPQNSVPDSFPKFVLHDCTVQWYMRFLTDLLNDPRANYIDGELRAKIDHYKLPWRFPDMKYT